MAASNTRVDTDNKYDDGMQSMLSGRIQESGLRKIAFRNHKIAAADQQTATEGQGSGSATRGKQDLTSAEATAFELPGFPPWLRAPYEQIAVRLHDARIPHALMVHGAPGTGKRILAEAIAAMLLCENLDATDNALACGECRSCLQLASGNHADFRVLKPLADAKGIAVDPTRGFIHWASLTANNTRGTKVGVIDSVEVMNKSSANAVLKTLEEPAAGSVLMCIADWPAALPATITSRCQLLPVSAQGDGSVRDWLGNAGVADVDAALRMVGGAPLRAIYEQTDKRQEQLAQLERSFCDIVSQRAGIAVWVERLASAGYSSADCLLAYLGFTSDIIRTKQGTEKYCTYHQYVDDWKVVADQLTTEQWFALLDCLTALYRVDNPSIKVQPVLETIFAVIWQKRST